MEDKALDYFYQLYADYNTEVLSLMAETIKQFETLTPSQAHKLAQQLKNGEKIYNIIRKLAKLSNKTEYEVYKLLKRTAIDNIEFAEPFYKYRGLSVSYETSKEFQSIVKSVAKITHQTYKNISKSTGIILLDERGKRIFFNIEKAYYEVIDRCTLAITTGQQDYMSAMRHTIRDLKDSGVRQIFYDNRGKLVNRFNKRKGVVELTEVKNTYTQRLDSAVRRNILQASRQVAEETQKQIGIEIGADGVEISHHPASAEDHINVEGRQYTIEEFEKLNANLVRPIGELNCYHYTFRIILGVQKPLYTEKQLEEDKRKNEKGIEYEGKHYTLYQATQKQRQMELYVRQQKDWQIMNRKLENMEEVDKAQKNIRIMTRKYQEFSKIAGLQTRKDKMSVSEYHPIKAK